MSDIHAIVALKAAIRAILLADSPLLALLGGPQVFDEAPRGAALPYVVFGEATARDRSGDGGRSTETALALVVWSRQGGSREALAIAARLEAVLHDAALALDGHTLVGLQHVATEMKRPNDREAWRAIVRLRAFTEPTT